MKAFAGYTAGANLGHWISQYGDQGKEHWDKYITERDFARMKEWGLDHVRVPVDYMLFEEETNPYVYREDRLSYIDRALCLSKKYGLHMILDLHHAPGFFFGDGQKNTLFTDREMQKRFLAIWEMFARRYQSEGDGLAFELLNELVWENSDPWNALWQEAVEVILAVSPDRRIIVGGNYWNGPDQLQNLVVSPLEQVVYTFHCYEPFMFTHQRAPWTDEKDFSVPVPYPVPRDLVNLRYGEFPLERVKGTFPLDRAYIERVLDSAFRFADTCGHPVYCGEYGVFHLADTDSAERWLNDMADILLAHGIGRAVWSYRGFSALTSPDNTSFDTRLVRAVSRGS